MIEYLLLISAVTFFALNMGGSGFAVSFASAYGSKVVSRKKAQLLFAISVFLGAVIVGQPVAQTLGNRIIPPQLLGFDTVLIILISASLSLFIANLLYVPQSTSLVTIGSILGVGLYFRSIYAETFLRLIPFWILLPVIGYVLTYLLGRLIYPPRKSNFWIYEKLVNNSKRLKIFVIVASCYNAFSIGTNNVANAAGPLAGADIIGKSLGLVLIAPIFGAGSLIFSKPLKTVSEKMVPLGLLTATIICLVTGTLMIIASLSGIPQSFVMIRVAAVLAISGLKNGHKLAFANPLTKRIYLTWMITPLIAVLISYLLTGARYALFD